MEPNATVDEAVSELYVWLFLLLAPICLVLLRGLDRSVFRSQTRAQEPPLWRGAHIVALILFWLAASIFVSALVGVLAPDLAESEQAFLVLGGVLATVLVLVGSYVQSSGQPLATLGFTRTHGLNILVLPLFYILSFIVWQTMCLGWGILLEVFGVHLEEQDVLQHFRAAVEEGDKRQLLLFGLTATVLAPVTEEIIFRGVFFGGLAARWGFLPAALGSSLVFAGVHFSLSALFPLFLVGLILCYLYRRTGSIYPPMVYHAVFNGVTLVIVLLPERAG